MAKIEQYSRLQHHALTNSGAVFTNPTSNDHTDETWSETDLYIGELGINLTDDTIYMRTNNGIVQIGTSQSSTGASSSMWDFNGTDMVIGATYSPTAILRNASSYVDLGSSTYRFKDLYLGGATPSGYAVINVNQGFSINDASNTLITTVNGGSDTALITMATASSTAVKSLPIHINSRNSTIDSTSVGCATIGSMNTTIGATSKYILGIGCNDIVFSSGLESVVYMGVGFGKTFSHDKTIGVGERFAIRGTDDDGTGQYDDSDWITGQVRAVSTTAAETPIFSILWDTTYGEVIQLKAMILGVDTTDATLVYSNEMVVTAYGSTNSGAVINSPIINEVDSFNDNVYSYAYADSSGLDISIRGTGTNTIKWLLTYSYHKIINI